MCFSSVKQLLTSLFRKKSTGLALYFSPSGVFVTYSPLNYKNTNLIRWCSNSESKMLDWDIISMEGWSLEALYVWRRHLGSLVDFMSQWREIWSLIPVSNLAAVFLEVHLSLPSLYCHFGLSDLSPVLHCWGEEQSRVYRGQSPKNH